MMLDPNAARIVKQRLAGSGIDVIRVEERKFPGELFVVVSVAPEDVQAASEEVYRLEIPVTEAGDSVLVTVRAVAREDRAIAASSPVDGVGDPRVDEMIQLITSHSRSSLAKPSLEYIQEGRAHLAQLVAERHCLVFGRRGAGKTSLLVEGRRLVESHGAITVWLNIQLYCRYTTGAMVQAFSGVVLG